MPPHIRHTSQPWDYGIAGGLNGKLIQFQPPSMMSFTSHCWMPIASTMGLAYRPVNEACSAISSCHSKIDGYSVGEHPLLVQRFKGMLNMHPTKPRYTHTCDLLLVAELEAVFERPIPSPASAHYMSLGLNSTWCFLIYFHRSLCNVIPIIPWRGL